MPRLHVVRRRWECIRAPAAARVPPSVRADLARTVRSRGVRARRFTGSRFAPRVRTSPAGSHKRSQPTGRMRPQAVTVILSMEFETVGPFGALSRSSGRAKADLDEGEGESLIRLTNACRTAVPTILRWIQNARVAAYVVPCAMKYGASPRMKRCATARFAAAPAPRRSWRGSRSPQRHSA
jgi:hypothetical protein